LLLVISYWLLYQIRASSELFISLFSSSASRAQERFNHSNATGIDISYWLLIIGGRASGYVFPGRSWKTRRL